MKHPNRMPFEGVLAYVDRASNRAPAGARGHCVLLTREAAEEALPGLIGMGLCYRADLSGHDVQAKIGVIAAAQLVGDALRVKGYIFARDFPEIAAELKAEQKLGMSYEMADVHVADMRPALWTLTRTTFTGAAVLLAAKAAYRDTSFRVMSETFAIAAGAEGEEKDDGEEGSEASGQTAAEAKGKEEGGKQEVRQAEGSEAGCLTEDQGGSVWNW